MNENIEFATNAELQEKLKEVEQEYEISKLSLKESYENMLKASEEYNNIKAILTKRGIK